MNDDLKSLESFLDEVKDHIIPARETTIFALGGRSYYENPASDLLKFFLNPDTEHGLGNLFLSTYLECMKEDPSQINMSGVSVEREVKTDNQNRIDLQIQGLDWCLLIENKIRHWEANPFEDYEKHAKELPQEKKLFSVLSPSGGIRKEGKNADWKGVSYKNYCQKLRDRMATKFFDVPFSKWHIFAREFILHFENELYKPPMTQDQANFVEEHARELYQAQKLFQEYPKYLCFKLEKEFNYKVGFKIDDWGILITSPERWGKSWMAFRTPKDKITDEGGRTNNFDISVYPDDEKLRSGQKNANQDDLLKGMMYYPEGRCWITKNGFKDCDEAIKFVMSLVKLIDRLSL